MMGDILRSGNHGYSVLTNNELWSKNQATRDGDEMTWIIDMR